MIDNLFQENLSVYNNGKGSKHVEDLIRDVENLTLMLKSHLFMYVKGNYLV